MRRAAATGGLHVLGLSRGGVSADHRHTTKPEYFPTTFFGGRSRL
eukprot:COSAG04_NODE_14696_length_558_cov_1.668845_1_plen_44_part_10